MFYNSGVIIPPDVIPEELKSLLFDENGQAMTLYPSDWLFYDADGNRGVIVYECDIAIPIIIAEHEPVIYKTEKIEIANKFIRNFHLPIYLPEGYVLDEVTVSDANYDYGNEQYGNIYFTNGDPDADLHIAVRLGGDYGESGLSRVQFISINGREGIVNSVTTEHRTKADANYKPYRVFVFLPDPVPSFAYLRLYR